MKNGLDFISALAKSGLGLRRDGETLLSPSNEAWSLAFFREKKRLPGAFAYHHIGSTSIPAIRAKPIIDILAVVSSLEAMDASRGAFEDLGYEVKGENGISGRRYCVLYNREKTAGFVHLHAFAEGHPEIGSHLLFRDFLRANPKRAEAYDAMKAALLQNPGISRAEYTEAKSPFIQEILTEARNWADLKHEK